MNVLEERPASYRRVWAAAFEIPWSDILDAVGNVEPKFML